MRNPFHSTDALARLVAAEQVRAHYAQLPAMAGAQSVGALFTAWVLWHAVDHHHHLVAGLLAIGLLSALRLLLHRHFSALPSARHGEMRWRLLAVLGAFASGCIWGSAAPLLYPPTLAAGHGVFVLVLLTLLPIVPLAALAVYLPAFHAYFLPCVLPFIATLAWQGGWPEQMAALLVAMMSGAMVAFARRYSASLAESIRLRMQLQRQSDQLQAAVAHKSQFIAAASHDLRQPVQAMGLFLAALRDDGGQVGDAALIDHLDASLRNLRTMLTNMLDLSRLDADALSPRLQPVLVDGLLARLLAEQRPLAAARALVLRWRPGCAGAAAQADPALLERMLRNLLANALKYTRAGGVTLVCRRRGAALWLQVFDSGSGIAPAWQGRVFEPFTRGDDALRGDADGLGLGLAITQRMAAVQGLQLRLHSRPGRGSVFTIVLPVAAVLPTEHAAPAPAAPAAMAAIAGGAPPRLVLVVDDDPAVAAATAALLRVWGHDTLVCHADADALAAVAAARRVPDLLITDARLAGGRSGLALAARIGQRIGRPLPVIVLTGDTAPERITQAAAAGHPLLHKPVDPQRLRACIAAVWRQAAPPHGA